MLNFIHARARLRAIGQILDFNVTHRSALRGLRSIDNRVGCYFDRATPKTAPRAHSNRAGWQAAMEHVGGKILRFVAVADPAHEHTHTHVRNCSRKARRNGCGRVAPPRSIPAPPHQHPSNHRRPDSEASRPAPPRLIRRPASSSPILAVRPQCGISRHTRLYLYETAVPRKGYGQGPAQAPR